MGIALGVVRESEVNNVRQVLNVNSTGCYVGTHKKLDPLVTEGLHHQVTLLLAQVAMQG